MSPASLVAFLSFFVPAAALQAALSKEAILRASSDTHEDEVDWSLCSGNVQSNLGGMGPDAGEEAIRFSDIATVNEQAIDLLITNITTYTPKNTAVNGRATCFGIINLRSGSDVTLKFRFVKSGTLDLMEDHDFLYSVYDVDGYNKAEVKEKVTFVSAVDGFWLMPNTELEVFGVAGQALTFQSTENGNAKDNPQYPNGLSKLEESRTFTVQMKGRSEFDVTFAAPAPAGVSSGGRNFMFAGKSDLVENGDFEDCTAGECEIWADPHVSGFDSTASGPIALRAARDDPNFDVNVYDVGDFWLVRSDRMHIQGRYRLAEEFGPDKAGVGAIAVGGPFLDGNKFIVEPKDGTVTWNGEVLAQNSEFTWDTAKGPVKAWTYVDAAHVEGSAPSGVTINMPDGVQLKVRRFNQHLDAKIVMRKSAGVIDGQCGNFNGDAEDDTTDHVSERMGSLTVLASELLFTSQ